MLVCPMNVLLIYLIKNYVVFSNLGFHLNSNVFCFCGCLLCVD
jgi:hypothetical protein